MKLIFITGKTFSHSLSVPVSLSKFIIIIVVVVVVVSSHHYYYS